MILCFFGRSDSVRICAKLLANLPENPPEVRVRSPGRVPRRCRDPAFLPQMPRREAGRDRYLRPVTARATISRMTSLVPP